MKEKWMNLSRFNTLQDFFHHWEEILECEYMRSYKDCLYIRCYSDDNDPALFSHDPSKKSVGTTELDKVCSLLPIFGWSMGELYLYRKFVGIPLTNPEE